MKKKAIFMINVSNELKVSEIKFFSKAIARKITLSLKFALIILTCKRVLMSQSGFKEPGFENRRMFSKKAREPYYAFKNSRLLAFPNHAQLNKRSKQFDNHGR